MRPDGLQPRVVSVTPPTPDKDSEEHSQMTAHLLLFPGYQLVGSST